MAVVIEEDSFLLYNSQICRLCAEENTNGSSLYASDEEEDICALINKYLPLKISNDGKYPRWICPGCHIQVESTVQFFDLVINGQEQLRLLYKNEKDFEKEQIEYETIVDDSQQYWIANNEIDLKNLEAANENIINNDLQAALFPSDHQLTQSMDLQEKPKKKRGRPPKVSREVLEAQQKEQDAILEKEKALKEVQSEAEDGEGRKKRRIKIPSRFQEAVQGKELERIYIEKGVIDKTDLVTDDENDVDEVLHGSSEHDYHDEIIGHLQSNNGSNLADVVIVNKRERKTRRSQMTRSKRKTKFMCYICNKGFLHEIRFLAHRSSHHNVRFECTECMQHYPERSELQQHQDETGHKGKGIIETLQEYKIDNENESLKESYNDSIELNNEIFSIAQNSTEEKQLNTLCTVNNSSELNKNIEPLHSAETMKTQHIIIPKLTEIINNKNLLIKSDNDNNHGNTLAMLYNKNHCVDIIDEDTNKENVQSCKFCNINFKSLALLNDHYKNVHKLETVDDKKEVLEINNCTDLIETIENKVEINEAKEMVNKTKKYSCDICNREFRNKSSVLYHKDSKHNTNRRFVCSKCNRTFKHKQLLQRHQLVHSSDRPFVCTTCGTTFKTKANLLNHQPIHTGRKSFQCSICDQCFSYKTSLKLHYRWHDGSKPYSCEVCKKSFTQNGNLQEHMRIHTGERPFQCLYCDKSFTTSSQCKLHIKRHTGERPFKCETCEKTFLNHERYKIHLRRHKGDRPYICGYCSRGFTEQWALKKHIRCHTGEKPYICKYCPKTFSDCSNLKKHLKGHQDQFDREAAIDSQKQTSTSTNPDNNEEPVWRVLVDINNSNIQPDNEHNQIIYATFPDNTIIQNNQLNTVVTNISNQNISSTLPNDTLVKGDVSKNTNDHIDESLILLNNGQRINGQALHMTDDNNYEKLIQLEKETNITNGVLLDLDNPTINQEAIFDENDQCTIEFMTSDGRKVRLLTNYSEPLDLQSDYILN